jgi:uncharacterized membrane protein
MITVLKSNSELRATARNSLKGNWGKSILTIIIYFILTLLINSGSKFESMGWLFSILAFVLTGAWSAGLLTYFMHLIRQEKLSVNLLFSQLNRLFSFFFLLLFQVLFILLWSLPLLALAFLDERLYRIHLILFIPLLILFAIPPILASLRYSQSFYLFIDNPEMKPLKVINRSKELMDGQKWKYVLLLLSFIGWYILCIPTFFIGFLWLIPYFCATQASFYQELIKNPENG